MRIKDTDKVDKLPYRQSRWQNLLDRGWNMYDLKWDHYGFRDWPYWKIRDRIIEHNIGKSFDNAFSHYCTLVPKHYQSSFLDEFNKDWSDYYLDKNKVIKKLPSRRLRKKRFIVTSHDHEYGYTHKVTGEIMSKNDRNWWRNTNNYYYDTIKGYSVEFKYDCKDYRRLKEDERKRGLKVNRRNKKQNEKYYDSLLHYIDFKQKQKDKEESEIKLISHGFDPKKSFKNH